MKFVRKLLHRSEKPVASKWVVRGLFGLLVVSVFLAAYWQTRFVLLQRRHRQLEAEYLRLENTKLEAIELPIQVLSE